MSFALNIISLIATAIVFGGLIYYILNLAFGRLYFFNHSLINNKVKVKHIVFYGIAVFLLLKFTVFYRPW